MIAEDYVNFETSKLLKEKGFDMHVSSFYDDEGKFSRKEADWNWNTGSHYSAPTLQMAMKWLRNKHKMFVLIEYSTFDFDAIRPFLWSIREMKIDGGLICGSYYSSYEKACEAAIKYALENLI